MSSIEIRFQGGTSLDLPGSRGAVNLMTATLEEGAGDLDAQGFAEARDALAAGFGFSAGKDAVGISARFLTENGDAALELLRQAILEPRFDTDAVERVKGQILAGLASDEKDPQSIAGRTFNALAWGGHPYGTSGDGTAESVAALTRDDVVDAHRAALARDRMHVAVVGDITPEQLGVTLDALLGGLPDIGRQMPGRAAFGLQGGVTVVDFPSPQSVVIFGQEGPSRDDPDFFAAFVMNEVLGGGGFNARLMDELREKRGLTYGVSTYLSPMQLGATMLGQVSTANATVAQVIDLIRAEWARMAADGITPEELEATKTYLTGAYPLRFDGNGQIADILVGMQMEGLPPSYVTSRNAQIDAVTLDDVKRAAKRLMRPDALHFVVVGQPEGIASTN